jgi:hypothetical protein
MEPGTAPHQPMGTPTLSPTTPPCRGSARSHAAPPLPRRRQLHKVRTVCAASHCFLPVPPVHCPGCGHAANIQADSCRPDSGRRVSLICRLHCPQQAPPSGRGGRPSGRSGGSRRRATPRPPCCQATSHASSRWAAAVSARGLRTTVRWQHRIQLRGTMTLQHAGVAHLDDGIRSCHRDRRCA